MPAAVDRIVKHVMTSELQRGLSQKEAENRAYGHAVNLAKKGKLPKWWKSQKTQLNKT